MKQYTSLAQHKKSAFLPWFLLALITFMVSVVIVFMAIPRSLAAEATMRITQTADGKVFGQQTQLDIFNKDRGRGGVDKIVHPFTDGMYTFAVENTSNANRLSYILDIKAENENDIPLVFSVQKNGQYVLGGESIDVMEDFGPGIDFGQTTIGSRKTDLFTLRWKWKTETDAIDTALFGDPAAAGANLIYKLTISAQGVEEIPETPTPRPGGSTVRDTAPPLTTILPVQPPLANIPDTLLPFTGDEFNLLFWLTVMLISASLLLLLVFFKRRKRKDESCKTYHKNN